MRHAGDEAHSAVLDLGFRREGEARTLLENVEHGLEGADVTPANRLDALLDPTDRRTQCHAERAHLAFRDERVERVPEGVIEDGIEPHVVELVEIDVVGAESAQR